MSQLEGLPRIDTSTSVTPKTPKGRSSPTFEQLLQLQGDGSRWLSSTSPTQMKSHDHEEYYAQHQKKSVLTKVKEKAKKLRNSLSKKKHGHEDTGSPTWGITLEDEDEDDEDPEYLGAPMYESELAPETYRETARQHPRAIPVVSEKHVLPGTVKQEPEKEKDEQPISANKTITETVSEKLAPAYTAVSDATQAIASKIAGLTVQIPSDTDSSMCVGSGTEKVGGDSETREANVDSGVSGNQAWDKGVSVKEYLMQKFEPGEDERALSEAITKAISPRKSSGEMGMVEKVRDAVTLLLRHKEAPQSTTTVVNSSSPSLPISHNPHQAIEEESRGRILQMN